MYALIGIILFTLGWYAVYDGPGVMIAWTAIIVVSAIASLKERKQ